MSGGGPGGDEPRPAPPGGEPDDPGAEPGGAAARAEHRDEVASGASSPYRNLFVPLVVVPALIVMVLVLVFVLFGQIAGGEATIEQNLRRVQFGGANEREQALLHLVQQVEQNWMAIQAGEPLPWPAEGDLVAELERTWEATPREEASFRYVLAAALLQQDAPGALAKMLECLEYSDAEDPTGRVRHSALIGLASRADTLTEAERTRVREAILPFVEDDDLGLQIAAAGALRGFPSEPTVAALRGLLTDGSIELRGTAAVSLSHLGDASGADVLWELVDHETFDRARAADDTKFREEALVQAIRVKAVESLVRLARPEDVERLRRLAEDEPDLEVREAAMVGLGEPAAGGG
jgi:hypothetical protein